MKKFLLIAIGCMASIFVANAQKFAFIDMEYIMENIPAYQEANKVLNTASQKYQNTIEAKAKEAETLYLAYQKASASLSASQRTQKEEAIVAKESIRRYGGFYGPTCVVDFAMMPGSTSNVVNQILLKTDLQSKMHLL